MKQLQCLFYFNDTRYTLCSIEAYHSLIFQLSLPPPLSLYFLFYIRISLLYKRGNFIRRLHKSKIRIIPFNVIRYKRANNEACIAVLVSIGRERCKSIKTTTNGICIYNCRSLPRLSTSLFARIIATDKSIKIIIICIRNVTLSLYLYQASRDCH